MYVPICSNSSAPKIGGYVVVMFAVFENQSKKLGVVKKRHKQTMCNRAPFLCLAYPRAVFRQPVDGIDLIGQLTAFFFCSVCFWSSVS